MLLISFSLHRCGSTSGKNQKYHLHSVQWPTVILSLCYFFPGLFPCSCHMLLLFRWKGEITVGPVTANETRPQGIWRLLLLKVLGQISNWRLVPNTDTGCTLDTGHWRGIRNKRGWLHLVNRGTGCIFSHPNKRPGHSRPGELLGK